MAICAAAMVVFAVAGSLAVVIGSLLLTSLGSGFCFAPAMTSISDAAEATDLHQGYAVGVTNMAWAAAQVLGGVAGAAVAGVTGDAAPSIAIAIILVLDDPLRLPLDARAGSGGGRRRDNLPVGALRQSGRVGQLGRGPALPAGAGRSRRARREELAEAVGAAAAAGERLSVTGSGHSFTEAAMTDATMLRLDALRGVLDADRESGLVRVGAGTVLARPERGTGGARPGAGEPRRHRRADRRRGDLDRHPRDRRELRQHLARGSRGWSWSSPTAASAS